MLTTFHLLQEHAGGFLRAPGESGVEGLVVVVVQWLKLIIETTGALIVGVGVVHAAYLLARTFAPPRAESFTRVRLTLARYLALALEFQLGADILTTAVAPTWDQIGKLGAIAVIRTALNFFLIREMRDERIATQGEDNAAVHPPGAALEE